MPIPYRITHLSLSNIVRFPEVPGSVISYIFELETVWTNRNREWI